MKTYTAKQNPNAPWDWHIDRPIGVVWGVNGAAVLWQSHGVSGNHVPVSDVPAWRPSACQQPSTLERGDLAVRMLAKPPIEPILDEVGPYFMFPRAPVAPSFRSYLGARRVHPNTLGGGYCTRKATQGSLRGHLDPPNLGSLLGTSASLLVTSALLVVTRS